MTDIIKDAAIKAGLTILLEQARPSVLLHTMAVVLKEEFDYSVDVSRFLTRAAEKLEDEDA